MKHVKKIFVAAVMALVLTVSTVGMVADAAGYELCSHYWTVEEDAGSTQQEFKHNARPEGYEECIITVTTKTYNIRCRGCGLILRQRTETNTTHSVSH